MKEKYTAKTLQSTLNLVKLELKRFEFWIKEIGHKIIYFKIQKTFEFMVKRRNWINHTIDIKRIQVNIIIIESITEVFWEVLSFHTSRWYEIYFREM